MDNPDLLAQAPQEAPVVAPERDGQIIRLLLRVLSGRALNALGSVLVFAMGCWAMLNPVPLRAVVAGGFALFVLASHLLQAWAER